MLLKRKEIKRFELSDKNDDYETDDKDYENDDGYYIDPNDDYNTHYTDDESNNSHNW